MKRNKKLILAAILTVVMLLALCLLYTSRCV